MASVGFMTQRLCGYAFNCQCGFAFAKEGASQHHSCVDALRRNLRALIGAQTEKTVGEKSGVGQAWLNRVLNPDRADGIKSPGVAKLGQLASYLGVTVQQLMGEEPPTMGGNQSQPTRLDESILADALQVIRSAAQLSGGEPDLSPRAIAIAYALLQDSHERVSTTNIVGMVRSYLDRMGIADGEREPVA